MSLDLSLLGVNDKLEGNPKSKEMHLNRLLEVGEIVNRMDDEVLRELTSNCEDYESFLKKQMAIMDKKKRESQIKSDVLSKVSTVVRNLSIDDNFLNNTSSISNNREDKSFESNIFNKSGRKSPRSRMEHNQNEKNRRAFLRNATINLSKALPFDFPKGNKSTTAEILISSSNYITIMMKRLKQLRFDREHIFQIKTSIVSHFMAEIKMMKQDTNLWELYTDFTRVSSEPLKIPGAVKSYYKVNSTILDRYQILKDYFPNTDFTPVAEVLETFEKIFFPGECMYGISHLSDQTSVRAVNKLSSKRLLYEVMLFKIINKDEKNYYLDIANQVHSKFHINCRDVLRKQLKGLSFQAFKGDFDQINIYKIINVFHYQRKKMHLNYNKYLFNVEQINSNIGSEETTESTEVTQTPLENLNDSTEIRLKKRRFLSGDFNSFSDSNIRKFSKLDDISVIQESPIKYHNNELVHTSYNTDENFDLINKLDDNLLRIKYEDYNLDNDSVRMYTMADLDDNCNDYIEPERKLPILDNIYLNK